MTPSELYRPLDPQSQQIRLLRLFPSTQLDAPIHCSIFKAGLRDDPPPIYRALSYVWGDPKLTAEINIEGTEGPTTIGLNLSLAIRYIRHDSDDVVLWADALCINQDDSQERSDQVRMMGSVYDGAKEVIAWLGEEDDDTKIAMELVESWATFMDNLNEIEGSVRQPIRAAILEQVQKLVPLALDSRAKSALLTLAKKPYWARAWIYQELSLGKNVVIQSGRVSTTLDCFLQLREAVKMFTVFFLGDIPTEVVSIREIASTRMLHMLQLVGQSRGMRPSSLETLPLNMLSNFSGLASTDPRDKIFALLGFVAPDGPFPELITPDYGKSTEQVYSDVAKYLILTEQTLIVLNMRRLRLSPSHRSMPTWVPDWQLDTTNDASTRLRHFQYKDERALIGNNLLSQVVRFLPGGELCVKGFEVDVVLEVFDKGLFPPFWGAPEASDPSIGFQSFANRILGGPLVKAETVFSAYFRLAIYKKTWWTKDQNELDPRGHRFFKVAAQFLKYIFRKIETGKYLPPGSLMANNIQNWPYLLVIAFLGEKAAQSEKERLMDLVLHEDLDFKFYEVKCTVVHETSKLFRTESGSLGIGPEGMARGDALCHLAAHPRPFLLQPAGPKYTNIGDCNVLDLDLPEVVEEQIPHMREFEIE